MINIILNGSNMSEKNSIIGGAKIIIEKNSEYVAIGRIDEKQASGIALNGQK